VKLLHDKGADVEFKDEDGRTPLSGAAWYGHIKAVVYSKAAPWQGAGVESKDKRRSQGLPRGSSATAP
jgi:ankyrin repeat protein